MLSAARKHCRDTESVSLSLAPVSHRWAGLLMRGTLLHQLGRKCWLCRALDDEKRAGGMQGPHKPGLIFTFRFAYEAPRCRAEEAVCQKYIWLIGRREGTSRDSMLGDHHLISVTERWKKLRVAVHQNTGHFHRSSLANQSLFWLFPLV